MSPGRRIITKGGGLSEERDWACFSCRSSVVQRSVQGMYASDDDDASDDDAVYSSFPETKCMYVCMYVCMYASDDDDASDDDASDDDVVYSSLPATNGALHYSPLWRVRAPTLSLMM